MSGLVERLLRSPAATFAALLALCSAYLYGGVSKLMNFSGAIAEVVQYDISPAAPLAVAIVVTEICAPALVLTGVYRWLGALWLAIFTLIITAIMNPFWAVPAAERAAVATSFLERLGLAGAFLFVAIADLAARRSR